MRRILLPAALAAISTACNDPSAPPAGLQAIPAETALAVTQSYTLAAHVIDRDGNPRPGFDFGNAALSTAQHHIVQIDGRTITALAPGKATIDVSTGAFSGTAVAYVMPPGTLALAGEALSVLAMESGSLDRILEERSRCVSWHPDGDRVLLEDLVVARMDGSAERIAGTDGLIAGCGEYTADGSWIYFTGRREVEDVWISHVWRIRPDGTQLEQITSDHYATMPSPSPDGTRVAWVRRGVLNLFMADFVVVGTPGAAALDTISPPITSCDAHNCSTGITGVSWSPTGEWIAYTMRVPELQGGGPNVSLLKYGSTVNLVRPDGTESQTLGAATDPYPYAFWGAVRWSPDGAWLVGPSFPTGRIQLVHLASGEEVMLNASHGDFTYASWSSH